MADKKLFGIGGPHKPDLDKSTFDLSYKSDLTAKFGRVYPIMCQEAPAGSTFTIKPRMAFDMMPFAFPIQTNIRAHMSFYKAPLRILMAHGKFQDFYTGTKQVSLPYIKRAPGWCDTGSLADYMGLPTAVTGDVTQLVSMPVWTPQLRDLPLFGTVSGSSMQGYVASLPDVGDVYSPIGFFLPRISSSTQTYRGFISSVLIGELKEKVFSFSFIHYGTVSNQVLSTQYFSIVAFSVVDGLLNVISRADIEFGTSLASDNVYNFKSAVPLSNVGVSPASSAYVSYQINASTSDAFVQAVNSADGEVHIGLFWGGDSAIFNSNRSIPVDVVEQVIRPMVDSTIVEPSKVDETTGTITVSRTDLRFAGGVIPSLEATVKYSLPSASSTNHFCSISGADPLIPVSALPFRAYEFIKNYVFRQERIDPFKKDGVEVYNEFLTNDGEGADTTTPVDFFNAPYEFDQFTTCVKTPQWGNAPLVGITTNDMDNVGTLHMVPETGDPYDIGVTLDDDGNMTGISNYDDVANHPSVHRLQEAIDFGISINDFRNVAMFQKFLERYQRAGGYNYESFMLEFYGTNVPTGDHFPEFLGGCTRPVMVSKLESQASTENASLGDFVGVGSVRGDCEEISVFCSEPSYIMGLLWFSVTPTLSQVLPKHFIKFDRLDFWNPAFNCVGPQPVFKKELAPLELASNEIDDVFGYNEPYVDHKSHVDECHGLFRSSMHNFILQRIFDGCPELGKDFIYMDSKDLTNIFAVNSDTDKIFGCIAFDMRCKVAIPRYSTPRIVG